MSSFLLLIDKGLVVVDAVITINVCRRVHKIKMYQDMNVFGLRQRKSLKYHVLLNKTMSQIDDSSVSSLIRLPFLFR